MFAANAVPDDEIRKMTHENAMRWYSFDPFAHVPKDEATVGALRAKAAGHDVSIMSRSTRVRTRRREARGLPVASPPGHRRRRGAVSPVATDESSGRAGKRQMSLVGFMQASNVTVYSGSWRHPATEHGFLTGGFYEKLGRTLEEGCFDMMFFDDRLAMPGIYGGSVADAVRLGARPVKLDLSIVLGLVAGATRHIGLGATYSTTYYSPFHVARTFATLDHLSGGRAAWNVVTSVNDGEAQNFGVDAHLGHDARYDRADEFLEATTGLWDTWDDDALVLDRRVRRLRRPRQGATRSTTTASGSGSRARSRSRGRRRAGPC